MRKNRYPKGWDEARVRRVLEHYEKLEKPIPAKKKRASSSRSAKR